MTALTVYSTTVASSTLSTANDFATTTGGTSATKDTKIGTSTGWSELFAQGTTNAWSAAGSIGSPSGHGWLWDVTTLEGQQIVAGNWTPTVRLQIAGGGTPSITADIYIRAYVYNGGTYTQIGSSMTKTGQTLNSTTANYAFSATNQALQNFNTGDKLYVDAWLNVTANTGTSSANNVRVSSSSTSGQGIANNVSIVTPGYQANVTNNNMSAEDDLTLIESISYSAELAATEAPGLTENVLFLSSVALEDDLTLNDIGAMAGSTIDANTISEIGAMQGSGVDANTLIETVQFVVEETPVEAYTLTETRLHVVRLTPTDLKTNTLTESASYNPAFVPSESLVADDTLSGMQTGYVESLTLDDSATAFTATNTFAEGLLLSDQTAYSNDTTNIEAAQLVEIGAMQIAYAELLLLSEIGAMQGSTIDALIADDSASQFAVEQSRIEALVLVETFLATVRITPTDLKNNILSSSIRYSDTFLPVENYTLFETYSTINNNLMTSESDLILVDIFLASNATISTENNTITEYMLEYAYQADPTTQILTTAAAVISNMWTHAWNTQAATKQHNQSYLITGGMYINWDQNINWSSYDQYTDINMASVDSNMPAHGLTSINLHDPQVCLQYLRTVSQYKNNAPNDHTFDGNNAAGYMSVSSMVDHVYNDFLPRYTSGTFGGYSNPKGWVYFALLDCYLNLQYSPLLTATQLTHLQQAALYQAWTYYNSWYDSTAQVFGDTGSHTYQPSQSLLMCAALLDACQRWSTQITTGMFYLASGAAQSPTLWTNAANAGIASIASRGSFNATTGLFYGVMNIKDGLTTDTINSTQAKLGDLAEVAQAYIRLYNLTGTSTYLTNANNLLKTLELLFWDNQFGGYWFAINGDGTGLVTNYKECRATAHMLIAYHMYNAISPLYIDKERSIVYILCVKMYKLYGGTGFWYRVNSDIDYSVFLDNYAPAFSSTLSAGASAGASSIQIQSSVGLGKSGSIDLILDMGQAAEEELAFTLPATIVGGGNTDLASDTFGGRTVSGGWGTSDDTNADVWVKLSGSGTLSVGNDEGQLASPNSTTVMQLGSLSVADCDASVRFSVASLSDRPGIILRINGTNTYYELQFAGATTVKLLKVVSGTTSTIASAAPGITISTGTFYWLRFLVQGTSLSGKIWADSTGIEPATWNVTGTDSAIASGGVGLVGVATTSTADTYDSYQIAPPPPYQLAINSLSNGGTGQLANAHTSGAAIQSLDFPLDNIEDEYTTEAMCGTLTYLQVVTIANNPMIAEDDLTLKSIGTMQGSTIDANTLTETVLFSAGETSAELMVLNDTYLSNIQTISIDSNILSESANYSNTLVPVDANILIESMQTGGNAVYVDAGILLDSITFTSSSAYTELLSISNSILYVNAVVVVESGIIIEGMTFSGSIIAFHIAWKTRDMTIAWKTRDMLMKLLTRDMKAEWKTRDMDTQWKTRDMEIDWRSHG